MKIQIKKDPEKAKSLLRMADITLLRLKETNLLKYPSNSLIDYYDSIHKILESISIINGIKISGDGAHQELIDYVCKTYKINESIRVLLQQLRDYRNRISYEGFMITESYIKQNKDKIEEIIKLLKNLIIFN